MLNVLHRQQIITASEESDSVSTNFGTYDNAWGHDADNIS